MANSSRSLIWGSGSAPARRVQIALHEKELAYDSQLIEFSKGEHKTEEVLRKNPRGQVPILTDGDVVVCESVAAIIYLEEAYPTQGTPLLPPINQLAARAKVWQRLLEADNLARTATALFWVQTMPQSDADKQRLPKLWADLDKEVSRWEATLESEKTQYIAGPAFTAADVAMVPYVMLLKRGNLDMSKYPRLTAYADLVAARPTVVATTPPHWKDTKASFFERKD